MDCSHAERDYAAYRYKRHNGEGLTNLPATITIGAAPTDVLSKIEGDLITKSLAKRYRSSDPIAIPRKRVAYNTEEEWLARPKEQSNEELRLMGKYYTATPEYQNVVGFTDDRSGSRSETLIREGVEMNPGPGSVTTPDSPASPKCFYCSEVGHYKRDCPKLAAARRAPCKICHKPGHLASACRSKAKGSPRLNNNNDARSLVAVQLVEEQDKAQAILDVAKEIVQEKIDAEESLAKEIDPELAEVLESIDQVVGDEKLMAMMPQPPPPEKLPNPRDDVEMKTFTKYMPASTLGSWFRLGLGVVGSLVLIAGVRKLQKTEMLSDLVKLGKLALDSTKESLASTGKMNANTLQAQFMKESINYGKNLVKCVPFAGLFYGSLGYVQRCFTEVTCAPLKHELRMVEFEKEDTTDKRGDLVSLSELKHKDAMVVRSEFTTTYVPFKPPSLIFQDWMKAETSKYLSWKQLLTTQKTYFNFSVELSGQMLTQPVCNLASDDTTTWLRLNQSLRSLHTVNEDKLSPFYKKTQLIRQQTALATQFIFECSKQELGQVPFPNGQ